MFYFNEKILDLWDVFLTVSKFYPIGISHDNFELLYESYPGLKYKREIIEENIYNDNTHDKRWVSFCKHIETLTNQEIINTTSPLGSCYSGALQLKKTTSEELKRTKKLLFFVSLLGPFYTIIGVDDNVVSVDKYFYQSVNYLVVSPVREYQPFFLEIEKDIELRFPKYRFLPFAICKKIINGLSLNQRENNCSVFDALFIQNFDLQTGFIGDEHYQINQWALK